MDSLDMDQQWGIAEPTLEMIRRLPALTMAPRPTALRLYLDFNHWTSLAKARVGRSDGELYQSCYQLLQDGVRQGELVVPLSSAHYVELGKIVDEHRRMNLANVMSELSQFVTLAGYAYRTRLELESAFHARFGQGAPDPQRPVLGRGVGFAFDLGDGVICRELDGMFGLTSVPPPSWRQVPEEGQHLVSLVREYMMLRGPLPQEVARIPNYHPEVAQRLAEAHVQREQALLDLLAAEPVRGPELEDILHARYLYWELQPALPEFLAQRGYSKAWLFSHDKDWITALLDDLPTAVVHMGLARQIVKNASHLWKVNDVRDIDALSGAVPYCDIVVTEKHADDVLRRSGIASQFGTITLTRLADLEACLRS
jgi:hypothetical protein